MRIEARLLLSAFLLVGCGHAELAPRDPSSACQPGAPIPTQRNADGFPCWPRGLTPGESSLYVENEALIPASPAVTWAWLTRADLWSTWFPKATNVHFEQGGPELKPGTVVVWDMVGATIRVTVTRADAPGVLAWEGGASGVHAYHAWLLVPEGTGTRVITVETERGAVPTLFGWTFKDRLSKAHDAWLAGLATIAASGRMP